MNFARKIFYYFAHNNLCMATKDHVDQNVIIKKKIEFNCEEYNSAIKKNNRTEYRT